MENANGRPGFKKSSINKILREKIDHWLLSFVLDDDEKTNAMRQMIRDDVIVSGGAISSMLDGHQPNDFDIYFKTTKTAAAVAEHYIAKVRKAAGLEDSPIEVRQGGSHVEIFIKHYGTIETDPEAEATLNELAFDRNSDLAKAIAKEKSNVYRVLSITSNAITLSDQIQIIVRFCGDPETIHANFDFIHAMNHWTYYGGVQLKQAALESLLAKELRYVGSRYPICTLFRIRKFVKRGWRISAAEILKIAYDVNKLDLNDINVLRDQLIGVDMAYFAMALHELKKAQRDEEGKFGRQVLFDIVDRVFADEEIERFVPSHGQKPAE